MRLLGFAAAPVRPLRRCKVAELRPAALARLIVMVSVAFLTGSCAGIVAQQAAKTASADYVSCMKELWDSPDGQLLSARIWRGNDTDTVDKLRDPKPLTKEEQNALLRNQNQVPQCRQIIIAHDNRYAAWETPYFQELFQRSDAIRFKLMSGEIPVGVANRLFIESAGKFQVDVSKGRADAVRVEEAQRQRAAEAMLASLPKTTTTNCSWIGNSLNCNSIRY